MTNSGMSDDKKKVRVAYLVSHPIQYQVPLLRRVAQESDIELTALFASDFSIQPYVDKGFGVDVKWDVPLVGGYRHEFLPAIWDERRTGPTSQLNYGLFSRLRGNKEAPGFDVLWVHGYSTLNTLQGMLMAKLLGIPVLLRAESRLGKKEAGGWKGEAKRLFFNVVRHLVDGVLTIGSANAAHWRYYFGDDVPQFLMPYAVNNGYFQMRCREAIARRDELLSELNLDGSRPVILFASKLQTRKRCEDLLDAYFNLLAGGGIGSHPYLVIVGDGEERAMLERRVRESGVESVRFCGFRNQSELPRFFDIATVFVLPSQNEMWGLVVNEVMNAARAVIVSDDVGCQPDLISDGIEGCVFPAGDVTALEEALRRVLAEPSPANTMGQRGLERISEWSYEEDVRGLRQAIAMVTRRIRA
ncbi:MAG: glycosyltransferase family 4 protein [Edaphobacter sp.]